ncbi:MAG: hypothetical protein OH338_00835 [Candidatus Parvarchaeota archaeon]|nr:hypothetical protein [Candidatus Parvarchaeota archaeon]MCW1294950.1 hypothetical protein [Candidatus Parvarchaeum tengchongense]MCW1295495.1 hypothetical protein [Candidatus Parvarchaeum tengchongense]MCW1299085.1 hypothetical protein [Candidatus Parvarchaeum tengchongense]MCW1311961.1 hypothetical protein [Candidatus Parvarchaeum tengchongense]
MEKLDEKTEVRWEASELLKLLLESRKEGLAYMHAVVDGPDFNYKSLEKTELNSRKYGLENSLQGIAETLKQYIFECDKLSFGNKMQNEIRQYLVRPYIKEGLLEVLDGTLDDIANIYKINLDNSNNLLLKVNSSKVSYRENIRKIMKEITEIEYSTEFVYNLEESIDFAKGLKIITYKKL